jgi:hypothetical protein
MVVATAQLGNKMEQPGLSVRPCCCVPSFSPKPLDRPLPTKDGGVLRTIGEACDYMTNMDKKRELLERAMLRRFLRRHNAPGSSWPS